MYDFAKRVMMSFKYRAITANCGNDAIGQVASQQITDLLKEDKADFFILNCQEADFDKTKQQLESQLPKGYKVACLSQMATHTKLETQFHSNTGIASFIIYKEDLTLSSINAVEARRETSRLTGSGYNKGGLVTDLIITRPDGESLKVQTVSGHLDASNVLKRNHDWHTLYKATLKNVNTWDDLVHVCPHLLISGYDANTRNKLDEESNEKNMWNSPDDYPEIQGLYHAALGGVLYSGQYTYNHVRDPLDLSDPKRPGYAARGMLDFVGISDGRTFKENVIADKQVIQIQPEIGTERDHSVIISHVQEYIGFSPFEQVRNQVASRLQGVSSQLASEVRALNEEDQDKLLEIYKNYLNPNQLLDKAISLHTKKLESFNHLQNAAFLKNSALLQELSDALFAEWFTGNAEKDKKKQDLTQAFLASLNHCTHESGIRARLDLYQELDAKINKNEPINEVDEFRGLAVNQYIKFYNSFAKTLEKESKNIVPYENLKQSGMNVLKQLDMIVPHDDPKALSKLDPKKLDTLSRIVEQCGNAYAKLGQEKEIGLVQEGLTQLSHEVRGSTSVA